MASIVGTLIVMVLVALSAPAAAGELRHEAIPSSALGRDMPIVVYVPDDYGKANVRLPVLYLLHGAGGDENAWSENGQVRERADRLISSAAIPPALIVMPGCRACWWIDGAKDRAETAFWNDLVPEFARRYRTIEGRGGLLIAGLSAGGYGTVRFAMKYPDRIAAVAAFSPAVYVTSPPSTSSARTQPPFLGAGGKFNQSLWSALNYPRLIDGYFNQKHRVPVYLVSGDGDRFGIAFETALLFRRLFEMQPDISELRIVDGNHSWAVWSRGLDEALKFMFRFADRSSGEPAEEWAGLTTRTGNVGTGR